MLTPLRIESVRGRLTLFYVSVLAAALIVVGTLIYVLLARALFVRVDENLQAGVGMECDVDPVLAAELGAVSPQRRDQPGVLQHARVQLM